VKEGKKKVEKKIDDDKKALEKKHEAE